MAPNLVRGHLPDILGRAAEVLPDTRLEVRSMTPPDAVHAVAAGEVELGLGLAPIAEENLVSRPFRRGAWHLMMPEDHPLAEGRDRVALADLPDRRLILFARGLNAPLFDVLSERLGAACPGARIIYEVNDPTVAPQMVANGVGLFLVATYAIPPADAEVVCLPIDDIAHDPELRLVWRKESMTPTVRSLVDLILAAAGRQ